MFRLMRAREEHRFIDGGRVACPLRERDVDSESCLRCGYVRDLEPDAPMPQVSCRPPRKLLVLP